MRNNHGVPLYLQAFLLPSARPCPPSKAALNDTVSPHISDCIVSLHVALSDCFHTDNRSVSLQAPHTDFNTSHVIRSPLKCQPAHTRLIPRAERSYPLPRRVLQACIMLRKSAFICTDSESGCGTQIEPPPLLFFFPPLHMCENAHDLSKSVRIKQSKRLIFLIAT